MAHHELAGGTRQIARIEDFTPHSELLAAALTTGPVQAAASELLGEEALLYKEKVNFKLPGGAGFSPHQDKPAYPLVEVVLSAMVAIDDSTVANGCLEVVSGHHREQLEQDDRGCIAPAIAERLAFEPVELAAGDVLLFHALTPHRSSANRSEAPRRALFPTYNGASEGDLRTAYYAAKREAFASELPDADRVRLSLIGDFEGVPA